MRPKTRKMKTTASSQISIASLETEGMHGTLRDSSISLSRLPRPAMVYDLVHRSHRSSGHHAEARLWRSQPVKRLRLCDFASSGQGCGGDGGGATCAGFSGAQQVGTGCLMWQLLSRQLLGGFMGATTCAFLYSFVWGNDWQCTRRPSWQ